MSPALSRLLLSEARRARFRMNRLPYESGSREDPLGISFSPPRPAVPDEGRTVPMRRGSRPFSKKTDLRRALEGLNVGFGYIGAFITYSGLKLKQRMNTMMLATPKIFCVRVSGRSINTGG